MSSPADTIPAVTSPPATTPAAKFPMALLLSKSGDARFLGHLDFARLVERSLRRSGLPIRSSEGFNPRYRLVFADALPLGLASEGEWLDVTLTEDLSPETVRERFAPQLPAWIGLVEVRRGKAPPAGGATRFRVAIERGSRSATDALAILASRTTHLIEDPRRQRPVDARALLSAGCVRDGELLLALRSVDDRPPRPAPVLAALAELAGEADPLVFGVVTKLADGGCRHGELPWDDVAEADAGGHSPPQAASSSSMPARAPKAG